MKRIGVISTSYDATLIYLEGISKEIERRTGDVNATRLVIRYRPDFQGSGLPKTKEDWDELSAKISREALDLALKDKCCCVALATDNLREVEPTVAELYEVVESAVWPPICRQVDVHVVELWWCAIRKLLSISVKRVLVLGTKDDMSSPFIKERLEQYGIEMVDMSNYPEEVERIDQIIRERRVDDEGVIDAKEFLVNVAWQIPPELPNCPGAVVLANHILSEYICSDDPVPSPVIDAVEEHIRCLVAEALEE